MHRFRPLPMIAVVSLILLVQPGKAHGAAATFGAEFASLLAYTICRDAETPPSVQNCLGVAILFDPSAVRITDVSLSLRYDPSMWIFRPDWSGVLCDFSKNGPCPMDRAAVGTFPVSRFTWNPGDPLPVVPGEPRSGATLVVTDDRTQGVVSFSYSFASPLTLSEEQNIFQLGFEPVTPFGGLVATYHDQPGNYQFTQTNFNCTAVDSSGSCGSNTPITGFDLRPVPEPTTLLLFGTGLAGVAMKMRRRLKHCKAGKERK